MPFKFAYDPTKESLYTPCRAPFFDGWQPQSMAALCSELSRLAYCKEALLPAELAKVGLVLRGVISEPVEKGTFGFLAAKNEFAVLAFRGTQSDDPADIFADADIVPVAWAAVNGSDVHKGFADALNRVWDQVEQKINGLTVPLYVTGHSLGAALGSLAASKIKVRQLITFGSPRVGDRNFCNFMDKNVDAHRYQNCCDLVCQVPPPPYLHFGARHYIDHIGNCHIDVDEWRVVSDQTIANVDYLRDYAWEKENNRVRALSDHTPRNYVSALADLKPEFTGEKHSSCQ